VRYEKITFVLFLNKDQFKLPEEQYQDLKLRIIEKAESMSKRLDPIVEYNDENPIDQDDLVKFYYFNKINLAIKYTPELSKKVLTNEIRHILNIMKRRFDENSSLTEYQMTSSNNWIIGRQSMSKLLFIILSSSYTQEEAESRANYI
jgi:Intu longin-like domain 3